MRAYFTHRSVSFGQWSRFRARQFRTRFGTFVWFVTDAEIEDPETGLPEVVAQEATLEAAKAVAIAGA